MARTTKSKSTSQSAPDSGLSSTTTVPGNSLTSAPDSSMSSAHCSLSSTNSSVVYACEVEGCSYRGNAKSSLKRHNTRMHSKHI